MTSATPSRPARLRSAEVLRALATIFVVVIHTTHWPPNATLFVDLDTLSRFAVPAFMLLTGVLLSYQYGSREFSARDFLRRRFSRSLVPWLAWAPVYTVFGWFFTTDPLHSVTGVVNFLDYGAGHLWFLLLIPQMYLAFLLWPRRNLWWWAAAAMALQTVLCVYRLYGPMPIGAVEQFFLWHGFQLFPFWIGYFAVGVAAGRSLISRGEPARVGWGPVAAAAAITAIGGWLMVAVTYDAAPHADFQIGTGAFLLPQEPIYVLGIAILVWLTGRIVIAAGRRVEALVKVLSENSLGVYILHPMLIFAIGRHISGVLDPGLPLSIVGFLVLTVGGLLAATLLAVGLSWTPLSVTLGAARRPLPGRGAVPARSTGAAGR